MGFAATGSTFVMLRRHLVNGGELLIKDIIHRDDDVCLEGIGLLEAIARIEKERVLLQGWHIAAHEGHGDHERGILDEHADIAMVGMIVPRTMRDDDVRLPLADDADDLLPVLQRRHQFAIVNVEHLSLCADEGIRFFHFGEPPLRQRSTRRLPVADVAIGHRHELHVMAEFYPLRRRAARSVLCIIRMCAEDDDAQLAIVALRSGDGRKREGERQERGDVSEE